MLTSSFSKGPSRAGMSLRFMRRFSKTTKAALGSPRRPSSCVPAFDWGWERAALYESSSGFFVTHVARSSWTEPRPNAGRGSEIIGIMMPTGEPADS
jgi:hypothetical protein